MQRPPEPTGAVGFFHDVNNTKLQFGKGENGFDGSLKSLHLFKSCFPNFWGNLNAAKVLFSHFDSFREFLSVKELSCTDTNIISDLAEILLGSVEPCG